MIVTHDLERPPVAALRGGDCHARDLRLGRNVHGGHRFATASDCRISNGLLRLTVGAAGAVPTLTIDAYRGPVTIGDYYTDIYDDVYSGDTAAPAWHPMGVLTIDSPSVTALLTSVHIRQVTEESITIRLAVPAIADAYVTLRQGERSARLLHGNGRSGLTDIDRRIRWTDSLNPVGSVYAGRIQEDVPAVEGFPRVIGSRGPVDTYPSLFSLVAASTTRATFFAGVGTSDPKDRPADMLAQLATEFTLPPSIQIEEA